MTGVAPQRRTEPDGATVDIFQLPTDAPSLEALLRDLFENHWSEIVFGPIIQGAAFEIHVDRPPTRVGMLDGYLTVAFGQTHFHVCIGETKGPRSRPTPPELALRRRTARAELHRRFSETCVPMSWSLQLFNGAGEQQLAVLLPNPYLHPETEKALRTPDWSRLALWDALRARWLGLAEQDPADRPADCFFPHCVFREEAQQSGTRARSSIRKEHRMTRLSLPVFDPANRLWSASLILAGAFFSLAFACAAPLAGFAAAAALTSARRAALALTASIWLANQLVGFTILHYPTDFETFAWGGALGVIALLCCETARLVARFAGGAGAPFAALLASFLVYEGALFSVTSAVSGDVSHFALASVARIFTINAAAFLGLSTWSLLCAAVGAARPAALSSRHA